MSRIHLWIICMVIVISLMGCQKVEKEEEVTPVDIETTEPSYTPPSDGKIIQQQAEAYIRVAELLNERVLEQEKAIHEFAKTYDLSDDLRELQDSLFIKGHPEVEEKYKKLFEDSQKRLDEVYNEIGLSEDEFTWIGGALADTINQEIRKKVETALRPPEGEGSI